MWDIAQGRAVIKKAGILYHPMIEAAASESQKLKRVLEGRGVVTWLNSAWEGSKASAQLKDTELVLSIGGDGTILRVANLVAARRIPILGINLGKLGFLTELTAAEVAAKLPVLLEGERWLDERAMLEAELRAAENEPLRTFSALNDVVVAREAVARLVQLEAKIDGQYLATYRADGVVVATATGSTAYSLAAGGPILHPQSKDFVLAPIMPHLCSAYSLVLPEKSTVQLRVSAVHHATLSIDGHINLPLASGAAVTVRHSQNTVRFLRMKPGASFYGRLEQRLKGK